MCFRAAEGEAGDLCAFSFRDRLAGGVNGAFIACVGMSETVASCSRTNSSLSRLSVIHEQTRAPRDVARLLYLWQLRVRVRTQSQTWWLEVGMSVFE